MANILFKIPDNIARTIKFSTVDGVSTSKDTNLNVNIPVVFGTNLVTPALISSYDLKNYPTHPLHEQAAQIRFYALSASRSYSTYTDADVPNKPQRDRIGRVYIDGKFVTNLGSANPDSNALPRFKPFDIDFRRGRTGLHGPSMGAALPGTSLPYSSERYGPSLLVSYIKAGDNFSESAMYTYFGPSSPIQGFRNNIEYPVNSNYDMLVVISRFNDGRDFDLKLEYTRHPVIYDSGESLQRYKAAAGNCLLEILRNEDWGFGLATTQVNFSDFEATGPNLAGTFDITRQPLLETLKIIDNELADYKLFDQNGVVRWAATNVTGVAITNDNIIGDMEIQYPDSSQSPTQLIANYTSFEKGDTEIIIGSDETNTLRVNIASATDLQSAVDIASDIYNKLVNTITIKFRGDRSLHQFSLLDQLTLSTDVFSATITIIEMVMNEDYTFDIVAEADIGSAVPEYELGTARPIIPINKTYFKPKAQERTPDEDEEIQPIVPPEPIPFPEPGEIDQPDPDRLTISGLNYPYNHITGADNIDWYLGSTTDGTTSDGVYDANGCRTRLISAYKGSGGMYATDFSLIFRRNDQEKPIGIIAVTDIGLTATEKANDIVGTTSWTGRTRYQYPGFFSGESNVIKYKTNLSATWESGRKSWLNNQWLRNIAAGSEHPYYPNSNPFDYVYQVGDADFLPKFQLLHTFEQTQVQTWSADDSFNYASVAMQTSSVYRLHFVAIYGSLKDPNRAVYIGSTTTRADGTSVLPADTAEAVTTAAGLGYNFNFSYASPPSRSIS